MNAAWRLSVSTHMLFLCSLSANSLRSGLSNWLFQHEPCIVFTLPAIKRVRVDGTSIGNIGLNVVNLQRFKLASSIKSIQYVSAILCWALALRCQPSTPRTLDLAKFASAWTASLESRQCGTSEILVIIVRCIVVANTLASPPPPPLPKGFHNL